MRRTRNAATALGGGESFKATDPNADDELTYTLEGPDASSFDISSLTDTEGQITVGAGTKLDFETKATYMVTVIATDSFGVTASIDVTIKVTDENEGPEIFLGGLAISGVSRVDYAEDRSDAVATYMASGPDADMATWSLGGDDAGDFSISNSGVLTFRSSPDYENAADADMDNEYMVTVMADDGTYMATREVTVMVTDVVEDTTPVTGGTLLERYDDDDSGDIDKSEVIMAINDYLFGVGDAAISKADAIEVISLYIFRSSS